MQLPKLHSRQWPTLRWRSVRRVLWANSLLGLLLAGILLVTAPLIGGLLISSAQIERVTRSSDRLLEHALSSTRAARTVQDRLTAFERAARQYLILHDDEARAHMALQAAAFGDQLRSLQGQSEIAEMRDVLDQLRAEGQLMLTELLGHTQSDAWPAPLQQGFARLDRLGAELVLQSDAAAEQAGQRLARLGERARGTALLQLALFIPFALVLTVVVTTLVSRPIRQLDDGIRALAQPDPGPLPRINMPRDLRALSVRLEWVRRKLLSAERDRQRLLGQVSHELKTPLSAIHEGVSLLDDQVFGELRTEQLEVVAILKTNVQRLQDQIESLLRFNRLRTGHQPRARAEVCLVDVLKEALAIHALSIAAREVAVKLVCDPEIRITVDRDMLLTALDNLLSNALKYGNRGRRIGVFAEESVDEVRIEVADQGLGIRRQDRARLFEPFFRGSTHAAGSLPGSGLGLAICRDLVRGLGGDVQLVERPGWSTAFRVTLPRTENETSET